jgi:prolipoprotein diacylglyceryltransferase
LLVVLAYGVGRFFIDSLRDDPERGLLLGFTSAQWLAFLIVPAAGLGYSVLNRNARAAQAPAPAGQSGAGVTKGR